MSYIYFNNAATSWPKPKEVTAAVSTSFRLPYNESGRAVENKLLNYPKLTRELLSKFFNAKNPENFQFTSNATESLNITIHGFVSKQKEKIHVITTDLEHNSVLRPLKTLEKGGKISLSIVPSDKKGYIRLIDFKKNVQPDTRLAVMNHASNVIGTVQDINKIGKYLKSKGIFFIVDVAQSAGHIKLDFKRMNCDAFCFTGHKSLFGIPGIGGFYIDKPESIEPLKQGGTGIFSQYPFHPDKMPLKFEAGTLNYPGIISLYAGIKFIQKTGLSKIRKKTESMVAYIIKELSKEKNIHIYNKSPDISLISFNIKGIDNEDIGYILLKQHNIICRTGLHCAPLIHQKIDNGKGCIRISLSYFNTMKQCRVMLKIIQKIAQQTE